MEDQEMCSINSQSKCLRAWGTNCERAKKRIGNCSDPDIAFLTRLKS
ncbi:hypothetical protein COO91_11213 (plasmid) [Nostoc flagelliforme CCNUN1]|uniref:Uncharacterized protein n=1 Tax=Nostoc flagelliforme CCNUN1 TaxID=2038116 RepID=A0A2K8TB77_9NOSO|nr:hypothetical protein COO91_09776 [Nostoc flagelliforme CCNUN1]AUB44958.1 hypothetical protein COO91_11213 [Nostoc flagelliforme CCNUN1]